MTINPVILVAVLGLVSGGIGGVVKLHLNNNKRVQEETSAAINQAKTLAETAMSLLSASQLRIKRLETDNSALSDRIASLEYNDATTRKQLEEWNSGIIQLIKQIESQNITPDWRPSS